MQEKLWGTSKRRRILRKLEKGLLNSNYPYIKSHRLAQKKIIITQDIIFFVKKKMFKMDIIELLLLGV